MLKKNPHHKKLQKIFQEKGVTGENKKYTLNIHHDIQIPKVLLTLEDASRMREIPLCLNIWAKFVLVGARLLQGHHQ